MTTPAARSTGLWYQNAIYYALDVDTFFDANADGLGDFQGLTQKLEYLSWLGVDCLWLLPFYASPNRDNGYDTTDHCAVRSELGGLRDFDAFIQQARERGMRVLIDLLMDHTSDQHPWFQQARRDPRSKYRDYYIWTTEPDKEPKHKEIFPEVEESVWQWDELAGAYYLHHFYRVQPDLNTANPAVREEIERIVRFWLERGVSAFRIDGAPYLRSEPGERGHTPHGLLRWVREIASERNPETMLCAEADVDADDLSAYFGSGKEVQVLFNFLLSEYAFLALARQDSRPIGDLFNLLPKRPPGCEWLNFLRNLDELDLERLTEEERQDVYRAFAPDENMRLYQRGIRRRLAPMLEGDRPRLELAWSLLFALPGAPLVVYGDEIGMGDDLSRKEREAVRTPMQWSTEPLGGFSTAARERLVAVPIEHGRFGYRCANVEDQRRDPDSLLNWVRRLIQVRKGCPEVGLGRGDVGKTDTQSAFAYLYRGDERTLVTVHNLAGEPCEVRLDEGLSGEPRVILADQDSRPSREDPRRVHVGAYGYLWFTLD